MFTPYNQFIKDEVIAELDRKCERCASSKEMLCGGIRFVLDDHGEVKQSTCWRLQQKIQEAALLMKLAKSNIPQSFIDKYVANSKDVTFPQFLYTRFSDELRENIWMYGINQIHSGKTFKYMLVHLLLKRFSEWGNLIEDYGHNVDTLVLDRYDLGTAPDMGLDFLAELVRYRYNNNLQTFVLVGDNPRERCPGEVRIYELLESWRALNGD